MSSRQDDTVLLSGVRMSRAAALVAESVGADPAAHVDAVRVETARIGEEAAEANLAARCLDGVDDDRREGWNDYVLAIMLAAG